VSAERCPDVNAVLRQLKDFQRATVECLFERFYGQDPTSRFLLADEVGLGKTLVAKGLIARAVSHLWDDVERIDIVYICSNADIARQNLTRLHPEHDGFTLPSRVTLLPLSIGSLKERKLNFISFTPRTSLEPRSAMGTAEERALILRMLREPWALGKRKGPEKVFQGTSRTHGAFAWVLSDVDARQISDELTFAFQSAVAGLPELRQEFEEALARYARARDPFGLPQEVRDQRRDLIGRLREVLAQTCIKALEPDIVLLDEFQRFRHLLEGEDDAAELASALFDWHDKETDAHARVLLMSATPYKMYTVNGEAEDDHYQDFVTTLSFLAGPAAAAHLGELLREFRRELLRLEPADAARIFALHAEIERELHRVIVRTERLGCGDDRDGMLRTCSLKAGEVTEADVTDYLTAQSVARTVAEPDVMEYWKSAPYLLNLLGDGYKLIREVERGRASAPKRRELAAVLKTARLLDPDDIRRWETIDPGSSRMRGLVEDTVAGGMWKLLWMPPSLSYYELSGPYAEPQLRAPTKRLVFSSWNVVPRAIAALISYAAEREMWKAVEPDALNTQDVRDARRGRLAFAPGKDGRLTGMPALALLFPSSVLASLCDPLAFARESPREPKRSLEELRDWGHARVERVLAELTSGAPKEGPADPGWYWAAPLLIDARYGDDEARDWLDTSDAVEAWSGESRHDGGSWADHVERAQQAASGALSLGRVPDDLGEVITELALFGWGTTALRALGRVAIPTADAYDLKVGAAEVAWSLRTLFNLPEVCAFVPSLFEGLPYWRQCLAYSAAGGLQAVLDEYVHLLLESLGHSEGTDEALEDIAELASEALTLRASRVNADHVQVDERANTLEIGRLVLRARFAARFGDQEADEGSEVTRADGLRAAFNSPFWPFVLASTSVGQEGLDFHQYCHAVVHWNLPPNPVDLEQREGRVHRYKNHAVRKNLAKRYGLTELPADALDPWRCLFNAGLRDRPADENDLVPFWLYPLHGGASIERHVPMLPLSREVERFEQLRRSLAIYRMAFGQSRQEDLVAYLIERFGPSDAQRLAEDLAIDLSPANLDGHGVAGAAIPS
jgi:Helicase conserved C-terminal domain